jgi:hypothetical protein
MTHSFFWTLNELRARLYAAYPAMRGIQWIDDALAELWQGATPAPNSWDKRMIAPSKWAEFAHMVGQRIGQEINAKPSG